MRLTSKLPHTSHRRILRSAIRWNAYAFLLILKKAWQFKWDNSDSRKFSQFSKSPERGDASLASSKEVKCSHEFNLSALVLNRAFYMLKYFRLKYTYFPFNITGVLKFCSHKWQISSKAKEQKCTDFNNVEFQGHWKWQKYITIID